LTCRVCFVKHMMITTQVRHHTHLDLSTCRVCSMKLMMIMRQCFPRLWYDPYMMISTPVRHHTHLDMSTCRVCSVKHMMIMRQYFSRLWYDPYPLHARGLGLSFFFLVRWSVICCQDGCLMASLKVHCPKSISVTILMSNAWEDTGLI